MKSVDETNSLRDCARREHAGRCIASDDSRLKPN
jgi:hypothetical protein